MSKDLPLVSYFAYDVDHTWHQEILGTRDSSGQAQMVGAHVPDLAFAGQLSTPRRHVAKIVTISGDSVDAIDTDGVVTIEPQSWLLYLTSVVDQYFAPPLPNNAIRQPREDAAEQFSPTILTLGQRQVAGFSGSFHEFDVFGADLEWGCVVGFRNTIFSQCQIVELPTSTVPKWDENWGKEPNS